MAKFVLSQKGSCAALILEKSAYSGVKKIAQKVCNDIQLVTGQTPEMITAEGKSPADDIMRISKEKGMRFFVFAGTLGNSRFLDELEKKGFVKYDKVRDKRECYSFQIVEYTGVEPVTILVIAGSDKRGTIYGLFHISELMGVSPWVTFSEVLPKVQKTVCFTEKDCMVSREPSVKYRGFFINDEWPAFGTWTNTRFGGFNAKMYDVIFETLLRLKGNYLWPAMWSSSFSLDGPGLASAELADEYGVVMSNSHHEPCLRHSEEWDKVRGPKSKYGNAWNYYTNKDGLLQYWRDGLKRNGKFENIITVGMRGERDSSMLGPEASLKQNIDLLKDIITQQRGMIAEIVEKKGKKAPQMIALYKEVEAYFYGNKGAHDGLRDWDGLDGVTFMLCEDNFGNMRTLPTKDLKEREGGWGMYYHFDYHGGPVSYEWVNSSYLPKVWEQMTKAYEFGIREIWVVNVGDLMFQEYPLSFFMDLAYDYDKWGISNLNAPERYLKTWIKREFGAQLDDMQQKKLIRVMKGYTKLAHNRKPEAIRPETYHPVHFDEAQKVLAEVKSIERTLEQLKDSVPRKVMPSFWALVYYPAKGYLNVLKWNILAGLNHFYANIGALAANDYAAEMTVCRETDQALTDTFHALADGKWNGFGLSKHMGFVSWNDEECRYPVRMEVDPVQKRRILAYVKGDGDTVTAGGDWTGKTLVMKAFLRPDCNEAEVVLLNAGKTNPAYEIVCEKPGLTFSAQKGILKKQAQITVTLDRGKYARGAAGKEAPQGFDFMIRYEGGRIKVKIETGEEAHGAAAAKTSAKNGKKAAGGSAAQQAKMCDGRTFIEYGGIVSIEAEHYAKNEPGNGGYFVKVPEYGKTLSCMKAFPVNSTFQPKDAPVLTYQVWTDHPGEYTMQVYAAPVNPHEAGKDVTFKMEVNGSGKKTLSLIPENYNAGEPWCGSWCQMVLDQIRVVTTQIKLTQGLNRISIIAADPGFLPEKLVLVKEGVKLPQSYLGPEETYYTE